MPFDMNSRFPDFWGAYFREGTYEDEENFIAGDRIPDDHDGKRTV